MSKNTNAGAAGPVALRVNRFACDRTVGEETWLTPQYIVQALGPFDLDPATPPNMPWQTATKMLTKSDDGLKASWKPESFVFHNPPYGRVIGLWMEKAANHGNGITLTFARTDTAWFHKSVWRHPNTTAVLFFEGRLKFCDIDGKPAEAGAGAPNVLIAYGAEAKDRLVGAVKRGALAGRLVVLGSDQDAVWQLGRRAA
jgi:hypothetical protein